ncbi:FAD-dependent oxidoreductase [Aurantimonas sp. A2-1-M11]|uniref:FAD-dependent oxidoreductase n=1 Tax=Aurantimonas sp. A2-1-M11 TaxID=3113712 RepID=UPI002F93424F
MLRSLDASGPDMPVEADVIVVGAGLAGLFLADALVTRGLRVLVLESGAETQDGQTHPLNAAEMDDVRYFGAEYGRFRCLGGTSTRWGGALLPYLPEDLGPHPCGWHAGWGIEPQMLNQMLPAAESAFGVTAESYEGAPHGCGDDLLHGFLPRQPKWPTFRNRSTANLFAKRIRRDPRIDVWTGATVTGIDLMIDRVEGVNAQSRSGHRLKARAPVVVLAAGAIETTRLLLLLNRAQDDRLFPLNSPLGRGFHDHLSAPIADLADIDRRLITRMFGFRFVKGGLRNLRFELGPAARTEAGLPAAFLHVAFTRDPESGFEGLRGLFQAAQRRQLPQAYDVRRILADLPWFVRALWWRGVERRVYPPSGSDFELHLVTEQAPEPAHRIMLAESATDAFGLPRARISWRIAEADIAHFRTVAALAVERWHAGRLSGIARLERRPEARIDAMLRSGGGIYHPAGTTRIGPTADTGVVDAALNVHGVPGLRALATSVFPTVGGASPSLALVQLALRMAEGIATAAAAAPYRRSLGCPDERQAGFSEPASVNLGALL